MRTLVTGCTGFAGGYLVEELFAQGSRTVFGTGRAQPTRNTDHLTGKLTALLPCDLGDRRVAGAAAAPVDRVTIMPKASALRGPQTATPGRTCEREGFGIACAPQGRAPAGDARRIIGPLQDRLSQARHNEAKSRAPTRKGGPRAALSFV